jgi:NADPH2:quinone reductase
VTSTGKHDAVLALGADYVLESLDGDLAAEVTRLTGGNAGHEGFPRRVGGHRPRTGRS